MANATPEDFEAFLARLRTADSGSSGRGRSPQPTAAKERAKFGSPSLRAAADALLERPESGSLAEMRSRRRKPKTAEDVLRGDHLGSLAGPGTSLYATQPAAREDKPLEALRSEWKQNETRREPSFF